jgi:outer membrane protein assembly factor BamB
MRASLRLRAVIVVGSLAAILVGGGFSSAGGAPGGVAWADRGMHVVGGPVAASGRVLVLVSAPNRSVWLEAVDPKTGAVKWRLPASFSEITGGVETTPLAHGGVVLALVPAAGMDSAFVQVEGVDVSSGSVVWRSRGPLLVADAPTVCPGPLGGRGFCVIVAAVPASPTALVALAPRTGAVLASVPNIERLMSTPPGVYQTYASPSVLAGVRTPGAAIWSKRVSRLFGAKYDPNYGWDFEQYGPVEVGTIGKKPIGTTIDLAAAKTVGLSAATGKPIWTIPGAFQCFGQNGLHGHYLCLMTGTATGSAAGALTTSKNATLTLEGFNPASGKITWRLPVGGLADLLLGNVAIKDSNHLVVTSKQSRKLVLDLRSGATATPAAHQVFWCARSNFFKIHAPKGLSAERVGSSLFTPCDQNRHPVASFALPPNVAGTTIAKMFIWAAPDGLIATNQH